MVKITVIDRDGSSGNIEVEAGYDMMQALCAKNYDIAAICGGCCSCATCHIFVSPEWASKLPELSGDEQVLVQDTENFREGSSRLACQIAIDDSIDGITIEIAPIE